MAIQTPDHLNIQPGGCKWNPADPWLCFNADDCGCYMDPCEYFGLDAQACENSRTGLCCLVIEAC